MYGNLRRVIGVLTACFLLWPGAVTGQTTTGTIFGVVRDQSGAVIPGVTVSVRNEGTGLEREFISSEQGSFNFPALPNGTYTIAAELTGFEKFAKSGIILDVNQNYRVDIVLTVGALTDQVSVETATTAQVETRSVALGQVVEQKRMIELPLNGRNYLELTLLQPGVIPSTNPTPSFVPITPGYATPQVGGLRSTSNNFLLDGAENNEQFYGQAAAVPSPDTLQEFRMITNSYSAEFGRGGGSIVNAITKSGTNTLHGGAYEFLRNDIFDARNFFAPTKPQLKRNQFGAFLGGPIVHNKTFFFGSYEGFRLRQGTTRVAAVPTLLERRGDFSQSAVKPVDPTTGQRFPNDQIPANLIHPIAVNLMQFYPQPNRGVGQFVASPVARTDRNQFMGKIDRSWSQENQSFFRYFFDEGDSYTPIDPQNIGDVPTFPTVSEARFHNAVLSHTWVPTPATVNVIQAAFGRMKTRSLFPAIPRNGRDYGFTYSTIVPQDVPGIAITGLSSFGFRAQKARVAENTYSAQYSLLHTRGNHSLKAGGDYRVYQVNSLIPTFGTGAFSFNGFYSGNPMADFLLGRSSNFNIVGGQMDKNFRGKAFSTYIQDDVRIHPRLTLNLGLRYEVTYPMTEVRDRLYGFRAGQQSTKYPDATPGLIFPGDAGISRSTIATDRNDFAPRVGIAWDVRGDAKTSLRAGYGVFYDTGQQVERIWQLLVAPPNIVQIVINAPTSLADPLGPTNPLVPGATRMPFRDGLTLYVLDPNTRNPYVQQFNLTLEKNLFKDFLVDIAYVGTLATKLSGLRPGNPAVFIPGQSTVANINSRRLHPRFGWMNWQGTQYSSNYNSLQTSVNKRFSHGYSLQLAYTWSKTLDVMSASNAASKGQQLKPMDAFNLRGDYGPATFDVRQRFVINSIWELPRLTSMPTVPRYLFGGWQLSGIFQLQGGLPTTIVDGSDPNVDGEATDRPDLIGDPKLADPTPERWFNTSAFRRVPGGPAGCGCYGNAGRNIVRGPGLNKVDFSITRNFAIGDKGQRAQFRTEVFNLFNHPYFTLPEVSINTPTFGRILNTRGSDERILQFGLRFDF